VLCEKAVVSLASVLAAALVAAATPSPALAPTPLAGAANGVRVVSQSARWTGLLAIDELKDGEETMFVISGELENTGPGPVSWVKLGYELLGDDNQGDVVLASEYGYNFRAEALRSAPVEAGDVAPDSVPVCPLDPGEKDLFRMVFFRADVPRFARWRVRILEVR
jgi:hypothetical protein